MSEVNPPEVPVINPNSPLLNLAIPPVAILLIAGVGYFLLFFLIVLFRYFLKGKGVCQEDLCYCCGPEVPGFCQCLESCADACTCGTPTIDKCLDVCCPKRNLDCVGILLCQCCGSPDEPCCGNSNSCCTYGDLNCNCACIQPDDNTVNCCCCQIGTSSYNRAQDLE